MVVQWLGCRLLAAGVYGLLHGAPLIHLVRASSLVIWRWRIQLIRSCWFRCLSGVLSRGAAQERVRVTHFLDWLRTTRLVHCWHCCRWAGVRYWPIEGSPNPGQFSHRLWHDDDEHMQTLLGVHACSRHMYGPGHDLSLSSKHCSDSFILQHEKSTSRRALRDRE